MSRTVPAAMTEAWKNPNKMGQRRPITRATIQVANLRRFPYDTAMAQGGTFEKDRHRIGHFSSIIFGDNSFLHELRNIKDCSWERSIGQDAATCTLTLTNSELTAIGSSEEGAVDGDFEKPGWFTYNRGSTEVGANRWGYDDETGWNGLIVPDRVVRTFEGYGSDPSLPPDQDPRLVQSGTWMIDRVTYNADGTITLEMRDLARLLLDQVVFPPAIPASEYPLTWRRMQSVNVPSRDPKGGKWTDALRRFGDARSSNDFFVGKNFTNAPFASYVGPNGGVDGHHARHAIQKHQGNSVDSPTHNLYWISTGQDARRNFVWWEFEADERMPIAGLRLRLTGGPHRVFVSVHNGTKWLGKKRIPWKRNGRPGTTGNVNINANIPFVQSFIGDRFWEFDTTLPRKYNAKRIRLTFTYLRDSHPAEHSWRAGIREFKVYTADNMSDLHFEKGERLKVIGNYNDYSNLVKWVCAWAGWYWPEHGTGQDFVRLGGRLGKQFITFNQGDPTLPKGRVWGDFMRAGATGPEDLTVDMFDKKPLMDIVNYVRDLLGFVFFIDETGGVVWRMPNLWSLGNYQSPEKVGHAPGKRGRGGRTNEIVTLDERLNMFSYATTLDSTNLRERIFVGNVVGGVGVVIKGFNPYPIGLQRTAGWTDQNFKTKRETKVMADMISARNMFSYRTGQASIPGYPKIQIDDQVRIFERVTNETYYHYVMGISSNMDMEEGTWTYDLKTHWLGERPEDAWVVKVEELDGVTKQYLRALGYTPSIPEDRDGPPRPSAQPAPPGIGG